MMGGRTVAREALHNEFSLGACDRRSPAAVD